MYLYRLQRATYPTDINSFVEGARITQGRWHSYLPVIYTTETSSLAILELLGYYINQKFIQADYNLITLQADSRVTIKDIMPELPENWQEKEEETRYLGREWFKSRETCLLRVPSVHTPKESNIIINPYHPEFNQISAVDVQKYNFSKKFYAT